MPAKVPLDMEKVKKVYKNTGSSRKTGRHFGVTAGTIINRLKEIGYPTKSRGGPNHKVNWIDPAEVYRLYLREKQYESIAKIFLVSAPTIKRLVEEGRREAEMEERETA